MIWLFALWLLAAPAQAQRGGCGLVAALGVLDSTDQALAQPPQSLAGARALATTAGADLHQAATSLRGCGCPALAEQATEAAALAEQGMAAASVTEASRTLDRARFSLRLARERAGREGCG